MQTYFFVAFENIFYGILLDLEIAGKIIKLYQAQLLFCEMLRRCRCRATVTATVGNANADV